jgi:hypothetical protein
MWVAGGASYASTATAVNSVFEGLVGIHTSGASGHEGTANTS